MTDMLSSKLQPDDTEERCGLILTDGQIIDLVNAAEDPIIGFRMSMTEVFPYLENLAATWHTHPGAAPELSGHDYATFLGWPDLKHHIVGRGGVVKTYEIKNGAVLKCD